MKSFLLLNFLFIFCSSGQNINTTPTIYIGKDTLLKDKRYPRTTIYDDSTYNVVLDPTYLGTDEELERELKTGDLETYYVKDHGIVYERIKKKIQNESFIESYWHILCGIAFVIILIFYKKYTSDNKSEKKDDDSEDSL